MINFPRICGGFLFWGLPRSEFISHRAKEITEIYLFALCPCRCGKQSLLFPTEHSKATKWSSAMSTKGIFATKTLKLFFVCSVPLREALLLVPTKHSKATKLCVTCQLCDGIGKLSFVCSVGFAGNPLRDIMQGWSLFSKFLSWNHWPWNARLFYGRSPIKFFCSFQFSVSTSQWNEKANNKYPLVVAYRLLSGLVMALPIHIYKL